MNTATERVNERGYRILSGEPPKEEGEPVAISNREAAAQELRDMLASTNLTRQRKRRADFLIARLLGVEGSNDNDQRRSAR